MAIVELEAIEDGGYSWSEYHLRRSIDAAANAGGTPQAEGRSREQFLEVVVDVRLFEHSPIQRGSTRATARNVTSYAWDMTS